jgi:hypothetical protein
MGRLNNRWLLIASASIILPILLIFIYSNSKLEFKFRRYALFKSNELRLPKNAKKTNQNRVFTPGNKADTTHYKILLMGDSELEALEKYFSGYFKKNGHQLAITFIWYSGTEADFAYSDTVTNLIKEYQPTYIVFVIGLNELFLDDFDRRIEAINILKDKFKGIKYAWIGPANFSVDKGINDIYMENVDQGCFFLSKDLILERRTEGTHPSENGSRMWMDSIARWMTNSCRYPIMMSKPDTIYPVPTEDTILKKFR